MRDLTRLFSIGLLVIFNFPSPAEAVFDISPRVIVSAGRLATYGFDDNGAVGQQMTANPLRAFPYFFGDTGSTYSTGNPGINAAGSGSGYPPSNLPTNSVSPTGPKFVALDVLADPQYWDGSQFAPVPASESLTFSIAGTSKSLTVSAGGGPYPQAGFTVQNIAADGSMHKHLTTVINAGTNAAPTDGVYLVEMRLKVVQSDEQTLFPGIMPSLPLFALFDVNANGDVPPDTFTTAQQWVTTNLVPFGDFNRDHISNIDDIPAMLQALTDLNAYKTANHLTDFDLLAFGDINSDGKLDNRDIQSLLDFYTSGGPQLVAEPASVALAGIGFVAALFYGLLRKQKRVAQFIAASRRD